MSLGWIVDGHGLVRLTAASIRCRRLRISAMDHHPTNSTYTNPHGDTMVTVPRSSDDDRYFVTFYALRDLYGTTLRHDTWRNQVHIQGCEYPDTLSRLRNPHVPLARVGCGAPPPSSESMHVLRTNRTDRRTPTLWELRCTRWLSRSYFHRVALADNVAIGGTTKHVAKLTTSQSWTATGTTAGDVIFTVLSIGTDTAEVEIRHSDQQPCPSSNSPTPFVSSSPTSAPTVLGDFGADGGISCGSGVAGDTSGAPNNVGNAAGEHYYRFTVTETGTYTFSTCNAANFDTILRIYNGDHLDGGTQVAALDDTDGCSGFTQTLEVTLGPGFYTVIVEGFGTNSGSYTLSVGCSSYIAFTFRAIRIYFPGILATMAENIPVFAEGLAEQVENRTGPDSVLDIMFSNVAGSGIWHPGSGIGIGSGSSGSGSSGSGRSGHFIATVLFNISHISQPAWNAAVFGADSAYTVYSLSLVRRFQSFRVERGDGQPGSGLERGHVTASPTSSPTLFPTAKLTANPTTATPTPSPTATPAAPPSGVSTAAGSSDDNDSAFTLTAMLLLIIVVVLLCAVCAVVFCRQSSDGKGGDIIMHDVTAQVPDQSVDISAAASPKPTHFYPEGGVGEPAFGAGVVNHNYKAGSDRNPGEPFYDSPGQN